MADYDNNRATFSRKEFRDFVAKDDAVYAQNPSARTVTITTNLNAEDAQALADKMLKETKRPVLSYELTFAGTLELDRLVGKSPTAIINLPRYHCYDRLMRIVSVKTDYETNSTTITVRG